MIQPDSASDAAKPQAMAVIAANSAAAIESAQAAADAGLVGPVLVGRRAEIDKLAREAGWDLAGVRLVEAQDDEAAARIGVSLARSGEVASLMKGHLHTDILMRAVIDKAEGLRAGRRMTHVFHVEVPGRERPILLSDAAINVAPDLATLLDIARNAVDLGHAIGWPCPKVALLSATEDPVASVPSSMLAAEAAEKLAGEAAGRFLVHGPLALDNAISPDAARMKGIDSPVAGHADIWVVPNIETGNALFKLMVHWMDAVAAGLVLGAKVPIVLTSRADPVKARLASIALAGRMADARRAPAG